MKRHLGLGALYDLSATPFFLSGSGWPEGMLFPWVVSDFSLMDAIECGIVKLPRVPVADNLPGQPTPLYRNLWPTIRQRMPKKQPRREEARPAEAAHRAQDRPRRPLRPLRQDLPHLGGRRHRHAAGLHRRLQQHHELRARRRIHRRLRARDRRGRARVPPGRARPLPQLHRRGRPPAPPAHAADRQPADRQRRGDPARLPRRLHATRSRPSAARRPTARAPRPPRPSPRRKSSARS